MHADAPREAIQLDAPASSFGSEFLSAQRCVFHASTVTHGVYARKGPNLRNTGGVFTVETSGT